MKDDLISLPLHIPPDALVLDVGSLSLIHI